MTTEKAGAADRADGEVIRPAKPAATSVAPLATGTLPAPANTAAGIPFPAIGGAYTSEELERLARSEHARRAGGKPSDIA